VAPGTRAQCTLASLETGFELALGQQGYKADRYDWELHSQDNDLMKVSGFLVAVRLALQLVRSGVLYGGVPCSLFVWMSLGTSLRSQTCPEGNEALECVRRANAMASRFILLAMIALARGCHFVVEQPSSSRLPIYPIVRNLLLKLHGLNKCFFTRFNMGAYGALSVKPTMLFGTPWGAQLCVLALASGRHSDNR
jgi:hypothetical protein